MLTKHNFRLPLHLKQMGSSENCRHRSGWHFVMDHLKAYHSQKSGILLDDFIERSFQHSYSRQIWKEPWVGIFHHPPNLPFWLDNSAPPDVIFNTDEFKESLPHLRGAIALSQYLGNWLKKRLSCPVLVLKHPTEIPTLHFSMETFRTQSQQKLVQIGWYARNQRAIYQLSVPPSFQKIHLLQDRPWVNDAIIRTDEHSPFRNRKQYQPVTVVKEVDNHEYDKILSSSLIFNEYWDLSASNTIIEAIARGTPLIVNRLEAGEEYLGHDYPLFYSNIDDIYSMINDEQRIASAAEYIKNINKDWMSAEGFAKKVALFVASL